MTKTLVLMLVLCSSVLNAQSIRIGRPANPAAADDVFVLRPYRTTDQQGYGTLMQAYVVAAKLALRNLADVAVVGIAGGSRPLVDPRGDRLTVTEITYNALSVLHVRIDRGRDFVRLDVNERNRVAILTQAAWLRSFNNRDALGMTLRHTSTSELGSSVTIVGVLPPGVFTANPELDPDTDVLLLDNDPLEVPRFVARSFAPILRLRPGVTLAQAEAALTDAVARLRGTPAEEPGIALRLESLRYR